MTREMTEQERYVITQECNKLLESRILFHYEVGGFEHGFVAGLEYSAKSASCLHLVQQLAGGQDWREWLERAAEVMDRDRPGSEE